MKMFNPMRNFVFWILLFFNFIGVCAQIKFVEKSIKYSPELINVVKVQWPTEDTDGNLNPEYALLIINYVDMPIEDVKSTSVDIKPFFPKNVEHVTDGDNVYTMLYIPISAKKLNIKNLTYGSDQIDLGTLGDKGIYKVDVTIDQKVDVYVEPLTDNNQSITVILDNNEKKTTPAIFSDVKLGKHKLAFHAQSMGLVERVINVTPNNVRFNVSNPEFDLRTKKQITIDANVKPSSVWIDGAMVSNAVPYTLDLAYGTHTIRVVNNRNDMAVDEKIIKVNSTTPEKISFRPREKKEFKVYAEYGNSPIVSTLYVNGEESYLHTKDHSTIERIYYPFSLPIGEKYEFKATYDGNEGSTVVALDKSTDQLIKIKIKTRKKIVWPWNRDYEATPFGFSIGYTQRQYTIRQKGLNEDLYKGTCVWLTDFDEAEDKNKWLNGVKVGMHLHPVFRFGLGIYTGLFWEYYQTTTHRYDIDDKYTNSFNKFKEHTLGIPLQLYYQLPFNNRVALVCRGGLNLNYVLQGNMSGWRESEKSFEITYVGLYNNNEMWLGPRCYFSWETSLGLRTGPVMFSLEYGGSLKSHEFSGLDTDTGEPVPLLSSWKRGCISISYMFSLGERIY